MAEINERRDQRVRVLGKTMDHVQLISRMARLTQTDLVGAAKAGDLSQKTWAEMVQSCRGCVDAKSCPAWLARNEDEVDVPGFCPNRDRFRALKALSRQRETERN